MKPKTYFKYLLKPTLIALGLFVLAIVGVTLIYNINDGFAYMITGGLIYVFLLMILPVVILFGTHVNSTRGLVIEDQPGEPTKISVGIKSYVWPYDFNKVELWMSHVEFHNRFDWSYFMNKYRYYLLHANDGKLVVLSQILMDEHANLAMRLNATRRKKLFNIPPRQLKNWT